MEGVCRARRTRHFAAAIALAAVLVPAAAEGKRRPPGLPPPGGLSERSLAATFGAERVLLAVRNVPASEQILRGHGARPVDLLGGIWQVAGASAPELARALDRRGLLRYLQPDRSRIRDGGFGASEPYSQHQWWVPVVGADQLSPPGPGVPLAVIDDGLDLTHPEFAERPETHLLNTHDTRPDDGHGTMVASVAAAPLNGVGIAGLYPQVRLRSADYGGGSCAEVVAAVSSAVAAAAPGVINFSGGFASAADCYPLYDAVAVAFRRGQLVVAAAGNDGEVHDNFPASYPHVITVAASDRDDLTSGFSTAGLGIDLAAPGEAIPVAVPLSLEPEGYAAADGTSFAAPLVSAAAAWAWTERRSQIGNLTQLVELVRSSARDVGEQGWEPSSGFGVLDLPELLSAPMPSPDHSEPNDDIDQVRAGGLFRQARPPLLARGKQRAIVRAFLDWIEDPVDVYRVWAPPGRSVDFRVTTTAAVDLEVFRPSARTVYYRNRRAALRGALIGGSYRSGTAPERFSIRNGNRRGDYLYVCVFKARGGFLDASYTLTATVGR